MDKKNTLLGVLFIAAGLGFMFWQAKQLEEQQQQRLLEEPAVAEETLDGSAEPAALSAPGDLGTSIVSGESLADSLVDVSASEVAAPVPTVQLAEEKLITLANEFIEVEFTSRGGAIRTVSFLQTKRGERDDYIFNQDGYLPALSLSLENKVGAINELALDYSVESETGDSITFNHTSANGLVVRRAYSLSDMVDGHDPYTISHSTTFENRGAVALPLKTVFINLGTSRSISKNPQPTYLNVGYFTGEDSEFIAIDKLTGRKGFYGIGARDPRDEIIEDAPRIEWSSVKNQFFAAVLSSEKAGEDVHIYPVEAAVSQEQVGPAAPGITGSVGYSVGMVAVGESQTLDFGFFVGPKEFKRLQAMGNEQDRVMQFGFLSFISKLLLSFMYAIHSVVPSWGWSIVIMTICIKTLFWPLTAKASRSQKRMAKIQGPMAEMKEKYKDNPQRMQQETMKLFKEHQVNPVAGCLPMFVQMPIFLGLFYMLRTASELRHESFLWVADLSQPDTLMEISGFPINILPLIMGATMFLQMSMMPVSPTADPAQQKIFKFLPFIFLIFLYNFSSGLVLYWTVQNILTIVQQKIINSQPDQPLKPVAAAPAALKGKGGAPRTKSRKK
ncbi:MAG: membrane protein insertase YidC [Opitutaceae bacterium]